MKYVERRAEVKARLLHALSEMAGEAGGWDAIAEYARDLGASDDLIAAVCTEVQNELWQRAVRLSHAHFAGGRES